MITIDSSLTMLKQIKLMEDAESSGSSVWRSRVPWPFGQVNGFPRKQRRPSNASLNVLNSSANGTVKSQPYHRNRGLPQTWDFE